MWPLILANWQRIVAVLIALIVFIVLIVEGSKYYSSGWKLAMMFVLSIVGAGIAYMGARRGLKYATGSREVSLYEPSRVRFAAPTATESREIHPASLPIPPSTANEARGAAEIPIILPPPPAQ